MEHMDRSGLLGRIGATAARADLTWSCLPLQTRRGDSRDKKQVVASAEMTPSNLLKDSLSLF